jgi:hypothetical protein
VSLLRGIPDEEAAALVAGALSACCLPPGVGAVVVAVAPKLLAALADLLERRAAGLPLPPIERAAMPDDMAVAVAAISEDAQRHGQGGG